MPEKLLFCYFDCFRKPTLSFFNVVFDVVGDVVVAVDVVSPLKVVTKKKLTHFRGGPKVFNFENAAVKSGQILKSPVARLVA